MAGTTLIDYALNKVEGMYTGLISWNMDDLENKKKQNQEESFLGSIASSLSVNNLVNKLTGKNIGRIFADVKISEAHRFMANVTEQTMEDGSVVSEHVILQPEQVTLQIEETNNTFGSRFAGGFYGPQQTFDKLVELWQNAVPLRITTQHKQYQDMVIANMPMLHRAPYRNALQINVDLKKLRFAKMEVVSYKGKTAGITKSASAQVAGGFTKAQEFNPQSFFVRG